MDELNALSTLRDIWAHVLNGEDPSQATLAKSLSASPIQHLASADQSPAPGAFAIWNAPVDGLGTHAFSYVEYTPALPGTRGRLWVRYNARTNTLTTNAPEARNDLMRLVQALEL